jgi:hypothetical protein
MELIIACCRLLKRLPDMLAIAKGIFGTLQTYIMEKTPIFYTDTEVTAIYEWTFSLQVTNRKGKTFTAHFTQVVAFDYSTALLLIADYCKRTRRKLLRINGIRCPQIYLAYFNRDGYPHVPKSLYDRLPPATIPDGATVLEQ